MWIFGNLFSKNPTILYTVDDKKKEEKERRTDIKQEMHRSEIKHEEPKIESIEHLRKWSGLDY